MDSNYFALVNAANVVLMTCAENTPYEALGAKAVEVAARHDGPIYVIRHLTSDTGEKKEELVTSAALSSAPTASIARVELWFASPPDFLARHAAGARIDRAGYCLQGVLLVEAGDFARHPYDALEAAYHASQNLEYAWNPLKRSRSASVGDVFVLDSPILNAPAAFAVASVGFTPVEFVEAPAA